MTSTRPARSTRSRPTDDELLDAARSVFAELGFRDATMSAVAERSNSTKPTLYAHFGDKDALFSRVLHREADAAREMLFHAYERNAGLELGEQVAADNKAFFDYVRTNPEGFTLLFGTDTTSAALHVAEQLLVDVNDQIAARLHQYLVDSGLRPARTRPSRDETMLAALLVGVAVSAARRARASGVSLERACTIASAFCTAALANIVLEE